MLASLSKRLEPITNSRAGKTFGTVINSPITQTTLLVGTTGLGLFLTGNGEVLLNAVDATLTPLVGSLANNMYAQIASLAIEAGAAAAALKSTLWTAGKVLKANALENENAKLKTDLNSANEQVKALQANENDTEDKADKNVKAALENKIRSKELANGFKKLKSQTTSLSKRETTLENGKEQLKADRATLAKEKKALVKEQETLKAAQKAETTKAHTNAKKEKELKTLESSLAARSKRLDKRETELDDFERANEDLQDELNQLRGELEEARAQLEQDQEELRLAQEEFEEEQESSSSDAEMQKPQQPTAREVLLTPKDGITLEKRAGSPVLTGFQALRAKQTGWDVKPESEEEVHHSDNDEVNSARSPSSSPSPHRH